MGNPLETIYPVFFSHMSGPALGVGPEPLALKRAGALATEKVWRETLIAMVRRKGESHTQIPAAIHHFQADEIARYCVLRTQCDESFYFSIR